MPAKSANSKPTLKTKDTDRPKLDIKAAQLGRTPVGSQSAEVSAFLEKLMALEADVPGFRYPSGYTEQRRLISNAGVDNEYLEAVAVMLERSPELRAASGVDPQALRDTIRFDAAYGAIPERLEAFARGVRFTILLRRDAAGKDARAAFEMAKALARKPTGAVLAQHVAEIKRTNKRRTPRKPDVKAEFKAGKDL